MEQKEGDCKNRNENTLADYPCAKYLATTAAQASTNCLLRLGERVRKIAFDI